ncbi:2-oxoglutarate ferredoxin oxidoreductase subunit alpha, partial [Streptomyces sp. NPDC057600]
MAVEFIDHLDSHHTRSGGAKHKEVRCLDRVIIRFVGDSGDGMQLTGDRFTSETASFGNDLSTLPNFPAEIR